ncbi:6,7-dimethyl-8-ribityllumazine synthase [Polluticoccus soli]|uniref:6,7-dimethyl-8-ribityllumazine synthase n=1 Tax=Polluticoccus soli TaxID=3034150 RepID=UPI0023E2211D|nr:6,7-dimethyl-8-ribityllumazine synthase [Flavipsychrobacter sp. JY13-12]
MAQSQLSPTLLDTASLKELKKARIAIVYTEWNEKITGELIAGAERVAKQLGAVITQKVSVPGSFELPFACKQLWENKKDKKSAPEAIIAFGAVIRGGTPHFEYVCKAVTEGIVQLNLMLPVPVIFGVLTLDNEQQAIERLGGPHGHKGEEAAITALKMIRNSRKKH